MKKFKIAALGLSVLTLTTCSTSAFGETNEIYIDSKVMVARDINPNKPLTLKELMIEHVKQEKEIARQQREAEAAKQEQLNANTQLMSSTIELLHSYVGITPYVSNASTTAGWDCSGLVLWFYAQQGINLYHSADVQGSSGQHTDNPKPGDIVVFRYNGSGSAYHAAIYIGEGMIIHAPVPGMMTQIISVSLMAGNHSSVEYRTLVETN